MEEPRMKLIYLGTDEWGRAIYKKESCNIFILKPPDYLDPSGGFLKTDQEKQDNLHTAEPATEFEGEPGWPIDIGKFKLAKA